MVLQRPVACEEHAGRTPWSAARDALQHLPIDGGVTTGVSTHSSSIEQLGPPTPDNPAPFTRTEYLRLAALRSRVREQLQRGELPDGSPVSPRMIDDGNRTID
jgi:hypothetical protein